MADHLFVLTGGPGSGKTSLTRALAERGLCCMPEAGRAIIRDQLAIGGAALPWIDPMAFAEQMLAWDMRSHGEALAHKGPVIFDRGVPDTMGYLSLCGAPVPGPFLRAAGICRYNPRVFLAPHWPAIYVQDAERRQSPGEAEATCDVIGRVYAGLGYVPIVLPLAGIAERAAFVEARLRD